MNLDPLTMDRSAARMAFLEYRQAFREQAQALDGELMRGYQALAAGKQVIRLSSTIAAGGLDDRGLPRLAVARADEREVSVARTSAGAVTYDPLPWTRRVTRNRRFLLPAGTFSREAPLPSAHDMWWADIPFIPPRFRPPHNLAGYTLLWEATWRLARRRVALDPALLKPIGGDLYAVLAVWDLTPLEAAVLDLR